MHEYHFPNLAFSVVLVWICHSNAQRKKKKTHKTKNDDQFHKWKQWEKCLAYILHIHDDFNMFAPVFSFIHNRNHKCIERKLELQNTQSNCLLLLCGVFSFFIFGKSKAKLSGGGDDDDCDYGSWWNDNETQCIIASQQLEHN